MWSRLRASINRKKFIRVAFLIVYDVVAICLSEYLALLTRFEFMYDLIGDNYLDMAVWYTPINVISVLVVFFCLKMYSSLWRYAGVQELLNSIMACVFAATIQSLGMHMFRLNMPRSYYILFLFYLLT